MLCSPPPATTLASSCAGSEGFCAPCCRRSSQRSRIHNRPKTGRTLLLHERLNNVQALLLFNISDAEMTVRELTSRGCYLGSNVSYNVKKMVQSGYLHAERSADDLRS